MQKDRKDYQVKRYLRIDRVPDNSVRAGSIDFDRKIYLESLKRFAKVEADIMLPGHGLIYFHKPQRRIEEALNMALMEWR